LAPGHPAGSLELRFSDQLARILAISSARNGGDLRPLVGALFYGIAEWEDAQANGLRYAVGRGWYIRRGLNAGA